MAKKKCEKIRDKKKASKKVTVKYICSKCCMKASKEKHLCKPKEI